MTTCVDIFQQSSSLSILVELNMAVACTTRKHADVHTTITQISVVCRDLDEIRLYYLVEVLLLREIRDLKLQVARRLLD
jgi:hypothetical protein